MGELEPHLITYHEWGKREEKAKETEQEENAMEGKDDNDKVLDDKQEEEEDVLLGV